MIPIFPLVQVIHGPPVVPRPGASAVEGLSLHHFHSLDAHGSHSPFTQSVNHLANVQSAFPLSLSSHARPGQAQRTVSSPLEGSGGRQTSVWSCPGTTRRALDMTSPLRTQESRVAHIKHETSAWPTGVHQCCLILTSVMRETELCNQ